jgi:hypothetical protein
MQRDQLAKPVEILLVSEPMSLTGQRAIYGNTAGWRPSSAFSS